MGLEGVPPGEDNFIDITTLQDRIRTQKVSPVEVVNSCLKRIERLNPRLNAFITVLADQALGVAKLPVQFYSATRLDSKGSAYRQQTVVCNNPAGRVTV